LERENERLKHEVRELRHVADRELDARRAEAVAREKAQNNLKNMALELRKFHDAGKVPDFKGGDWFQHILPYIEQDGLYKMDNGWKTGGSYQKAGTDGTSNTIIIRDEKDKKK